MGDAPLVSVIIPTYNYARFIGQAIESVLAQTHQDFEIIVVDDGSTDNTGERVARFPQVRYLYQANQGIAPARNAGLDASRGDLLVFLDADDRLLPEALAIGVDCMNDNPDCAFVSGHWEVVSNFGTPLHSSPIVCVTSDHYRAFLDFNYIGTVGQVMFRRSILESVGAFDSSVPGCDDIELYLRIARNHRVACHDKVVMQYRKHGSNTSGKREMMLRSMLQVYQSQLPYVQGKPELETVQRKGIEFCHKFLAIELKKQKRDRIKSNWLVNGIIQIRDRVRAEVIFRRYSTERRKTPK